MQRICQRRMEEMTLDLEDQDPPCAPQGWLNNKARQRILLPTARISVDWVPTDSKYYSAPAPYPTRRSSNNGRDHRSDTLTTTTRWSNTRILYPPTILEEL